MNVPVNVFRYHFSYKLHNQIINKIQFFASGLVFITLVGYFIITSKIAAKLLLPYYQNLKKISKKKSFTAKY